jgi:biotin carboxyl carrier protein
MERDVPGDPIEIRAEWAGRIATVHVAAGAAVTAGQDVVTIEAMKMLTALTAPRAGTVAEILVREDEFVDAGAVLARIA